MKEKFVMTTFFAAALTDVGSTGIGLRLGLNEIGIIGKSLVESGNEGEAYFYRMAVTAGMIGLYALTKKLGGRYEFSVDRAMRITNLICWAASALNVVQIAEVIK